MIELLGWISTIAILLGTLVNSRGNHLIAMVIWIVGDIGWIIYDLSINNFSHFTLSSAIIILNSYGIYRIWKS